MIEYKNNVHYYIPPIKNSTYREICQIVNKYVNAGNYEIIKLGRTTHLIAIEFKNIGNDCRLILNDYYDGHYIIKINSDRSTKHNVIIEDTYELLDIIDKICDFTCNICKYKPFRSDFSNSNNSKYIPKSSFNDWDILVSARRCSDLNEYIHTLIG